MKEDKGYIMVLALVIASVLLILLSTIMGGIIVQRRLVDRSYYRERALALAESGIDAAIAYLNEKNLLESYPKISGEIPEMGSFSVEVNPLNGGITIESTGCIPSKKGDKDKARRTIWVIANLTMEGTVFEYAIASGENITIEGEETIVNGDIIAAGSIDIDNLDNFDGEKEEDVEGLEFPEFDSNYYKTNANMVKSEDWEIKDETDYSINGIIYVEGNVKIEESTLVGPGVIVA